MKAKLKRHANEHKNWVDLIPYFSYVANVLKNQITGYSAYYLIFGRHPKIGTGQIFLNSVYDEEDTKPDTNQFVRSQMEMYRKIFAEARKNLRGSILKHQELYNKKVTTFEVGDLVMVYHPRLGQTGSKFHNFW